MKTLPVLLAVALGITTPAMAEHYYFDGPTGNEDVNAPELKSASCFIEYHDTVYFDGICSVAWGEAGFTVGRPGVPMAEVRLNWEKSDVNWALLNPHLFGNEMTWEVKSDGGECWVGAEGKLCVGKEEAH